jgi:hypothetical protein
MVSRSDIASSRPLKGEHEKGEDRLEYCTRVVSVIAAANTEGDTSQVIATALIERCVRIAKTERVTS